MGLDTTHDCWHGSYIAFHRWRSKLAQAAGLPPLDLMEGFYRPDEETIFGRNDTGLCYNLPIKWESLKPDVLHELLHHSDCDGEIRAEICASLADRLEALLPLLTSDAGEWGHLSSYQEKTRLFIAGLRKAASRSESVGFH